MRLQRVVRSITPSLNRCRNSSRVSAISLYSDNGQTGRFYADITELIQSGSAGKREDLWSPGGGGASLSIWPVSLPEEPRKRSSDALLTLAVSNLRTALRQVLRRGGRIGGWCKTAGRLYCFRCMIPLSISLSRQRLRRLSPMQPNPLCQILTVDYYASSIPFAEPVSITSPSNVQTQF
jgi:hypothetical protein